MLIHECQQNISSEKSDERASHLRVANTTRQSTRNKKKQDGETETEHAHPDATNTRERNIHNNLM